MDSKKKFHQGCYDLAKQIHSLLCEEPSGDRLLLDRNEAFASMSVNQIAEHLKEKLRDQPFFPMERKLFYFTYRDEFYVSIWAKDVDEAWEKARQSKSWRPLHSDVFQEEFIEMEVHYDS